MFIVPFGNEDFSALTHALVELLTKLEACHWTLGPRMTEECTVVPVFANVTVNSRILLEFSVGPRTVRNVAVPM